MLLITGKIGGSGRFQTYLDGASDSADSVNGVHSEVSDNAKAAKIVASLFKILEDHVTLPVGKG